MTDVAPGGLPANERGVVTALEGCPRSQALHLSRFLAGVADASLQIQAWLDSKGPKAPLGLSKRLFGSKQRLAQAAFAARSGAPIEAAACESLRTSDGWKLSPDRAPKKLCEQQRGPPSKGDTFLFAVPSRGAAPVKVTAAVLFRPAPEGRADRCRPRLSAVLFDDQGRARLRYHADYGDKLEVQLVGDGCQALDLVFAPDTQTFLPVPSSACSPPRR